MPAPCIEDGCGVDLSVTVGGKLRADLIIDPSICNGLVCFPTGAYVPHKIVQQFVVVPEVSTGAQCAAAGTVNHQSMTINWTIPACGHGGASLSAIQINWGTIDVSGLDAGATIVIAEDTNIDGAGFVSGSYVVLQNNGTGTLKHAWPAHTLLSWDVAADGSVRSYAIRRTVTVTGGCVGGVLLRECGLYELTWAGATP